MKKGFTLIELLVVVLIIGILSSVALPQYTKAVNKSRATEAWTIAKSVADAENVYFLANNQYTSDATALDIEIPTLKNFDLSLSAASSNQYCVIYLTGKNAFQGVSLFYNLHEGRLIEIDCNDTSNSNKCSSLLPCSKPSLSVGCGYCSM